jgi:hypothetical protein
MRRPSLVARDSDVLPRGGALPQAEFGTTLPSDAAKCSEIAFEKLLGRGARYRAAPVPVAKRVDLSAGIIVC